jgi:hypothetical protein
MTRPGDVNYHQPKQQNIGIIILRLTPLRNIPGVENNETAVDLRSSKS